MEQNNKDKDQDPKETLIKDKEQETGTGQQNQNAELHQDQTQKLNGMLDQSQSQPSKGIPYQNQVQNPYVRSNQNQSQSLNGMSYQNQVQNPYGEPPQNQAQYPSGMQYQNQAQNPYEAPYQNQAQSPYGAPYQNKAQNPNGAPYQNQAQNPYGVPNQYQFQNQYRRPHQYPLQNQYKMPYQFSPQKQYDEQYGREAKRIINYAGLALFIMAIAMIGSQTVLDTLAYFFMPEIIESDWYIWALTAITIIGIGFPFYYLFMRKIPDSPRGGIVKLKPARFITLFFICISAMYITNIFSTILTYIIAMLKGETELVNPAAEAILNSNIYLSLIYAALVAPVIEELIFRKILLDKLRRFGDIPAILMTGIAFGLFHMNLSQFFYAAVLGFIFAYITIKTNTVKYAILLHMMVNFISTAISTFISDNNAIGAALINIWVFGSIAAGIIFFIMNFKKIKFNRSDFPVRTSHYFLNAGVILYTLVCLIMIAAVTLAE